MTCGARTPASTDQGDLSEEDIEVDEIAAGAGAHNRPIARGSHYVMTPSDATSTDGDYTQVAIIDLDTQVNIILRPSDRHMYISPLSAVVIRSLSRVCNVHLGCHHRSRHASEQNNRTREEGPLD